MARRAPYGPGGPIRSAPTTRSLMQTLARLQLAAFLRRWPLAALAALGVGCIVAAGVIQHLQLSQGVPVADVLSGVGRYQLLLPLVTAVLSLEWGAASSQAGMEEALEAQRSAVHRHSAATLLPSLLVVAAFTGTYLLVQWSVAVRRDLLGELGLHLGLEATLNVLMPCLIGAALGFVASQYMPRYLGYATVAAFAFAISSYAELLPMLAQAGVARGGAGADLYPAYDLFRILAPDSTWGMDALYGFPLEPERWAIAALWLMALVALALPSLVRRDWRPLHAVQACLLLLAGAFLIAAALPSEELRRDYRFEGGSSTVSEQIFYEVRSEQHPVRLGEADYRVSRYDMEFSAGRYLHSRVTMSLEDTRTGPVEYAFTLYHGYRVTSVTDESGAPLVFARDGDYLTVSADEPRRKLTVTYRGTGGSQVANAQAIYLPGYFPYYPVPGFHQVWDALRLATVADLDSLPPTQFRVRFRGLPRIVSDLDSTATGFQGTAVSPTFVGGLAARSSQAGSPVIHYPASGIDLDKLEPLLARLHSLEDQVGAGESVVPSGTTVIQLPGLALTDTVATRDALFVGGIDPSLAADILVAATPARIERANLKEALARYLNDPESITALQADSPTAGQIAALERARKSARTDVERARDYHYPAKQTVLILFRDAIREEGADQVLRAVYSYLQSDSPDSELEFLTTRIQQPEAL